MKKMYQQPQTEEMEMSPISTVCGATAGDAGPNHSDGGGEIDPTREFD